MPCPGAVPGCSASGCARQRPALRKLRSSLSATKALRDPRSILIFAWWVSGEGQCRDETRRDAVVYRPFLGSGCGATYEHIFYERRLDRRVYFIEIWVPRGHAPFAPPEF